MKLLCWIGWHRWDLWSRSERPLNRIQTRYWHTCIRCGKTKQA